MKQIKFPLDYLFKNLSKKYIDISKFLNKYYPDSGVAYNGLDIYFWLVGCLKKELRDDKYIKYDVIAFSDIVLDLVIDDVESIEMVFESVMNKLPCPTHRILAGKKYITSRMASRLRHKKCCFINQELAGNIFISNKILELLYKDGCSHTLEVLAKNPMILSSTAKLLSESNCERIRLNVASNPRLKYRPLLKLSNNDSIADVVKVADSEIARRDARITIRAKQKQKQKPVRRL